MALDLHAEVADRALGAGAIDAERAIEVAPSTNAAPGQGDAGRRQGEAGQRPAPQSPYRERAAPECGDPALLTADVLLAHHVSSLWSRNHAGAVPSGQRSEAGAETGQQIPARGMTEFDQTPSGLLGRA